MNIFTGVPKQYSGKDVHAFESLNIIGCVLFDLLEFDAFRMKQKKRKAEVKSRKISQADFTGWLVQ